MRFIEAIDADDAAELTRSPGLDARKGVLEHRGVGGLDIGAPGAREEGVGRGLAQQVLGLDRHSVDPPFDERAKPGDVEHLSGVRARRYDNAAQTGVPRGLKVLT